MSFGKRGVPQNQAALRSRGPESALPDSPRFGGGFRIPKIVKQLGQIALTLGFLMLCFNFLPLLVKFVVVPAWEDTDSPSEFSMQVASSLGPGKINSIDARVNADCLAPKEKKRFPRLLKETTSTPPAGPPAPAAVLATVELATRYLSCAAVTEPKRFCDSFYREQFAANLSNYFESKRYYIAYIKTIADQKSLLQMKDAYASTPAELEKALLSDVALQVIKINAETAGTEFKLTVALNPKLEAGISSLVSSGLLSAGDFGWTNPVPDELKGILAIPGQKGICG
jgi:hypothetical protein